MGLGVPSLGVTSDHLSRHLHWPSSAVNELKDPGGTGGEVVSV